VGETRFPPRERAGGERRSRRGDETDTLVREREGLGRDAVRLLGPLGEDGHEAVRLAPELAVAQADRIEQLHDRFRDYELLLFDDGSVDRTGAIMDQLAAADPRHVRVTHNPSPRNLGGVYKQGIDLARMDYILMVPGDNENPGHALQAPFDAIGRADIVLPYPVNSAVRGVARHLVSRIYVGLLNRLFGLRVRYYNGTVIHRTANLKGLSIKTSSFAYQAEILIKLLCAGKSFVRWGARAASRSTEAA